MLIYAQKYFYFFILLMGNFCRKEIFKCEKARGWYKLNRRLRSNTKTWCKKIRDNIVSE